MPRERKTQVSRGKPSKKKTVIVYKIDKRVTIRKPRAKDEYVSFTVEVDEGKIGKDGVSLSKAKNFVKHIVTDIKELNFLKNDMGFLMSEIYGPDHSTDVNVDVYEGKLFYIWVYLPFRKHAGRNTLSKDLQKEIFPFDIFYIRRDLSTADCKNIINLLRRDIDAFVYVRQIDETPILPYDVRVT